MATPSNGIGKRYQGRYVWMSVIVAATFLILIGRLWYVQVIEGERYWRASTENIIQNVETKPPRGRIFDRHGNVLAENRPSYDVYLIPHIFQRRGDDETLTLVQQYLNLPDEKLEGLRKKAESDAAEVLVARDVTRVQVARIEVDRLRLPGISVRAVSHRHYPLHSVGAHAIGFVGEVREAEIDELKSWGYGAGDFYGRMGLERAFEPVLRGSPGIERKVVDARGIPQGEAETRFLIGDYQRVKPIPGRDLVTTIDAELQLIIDEAMGDYPAGAAVALDPDDGSVLAMYSKPSFNPNSWSGRLSAQEKMRSDNDPFKPMLDKTVNAYFPGSTFKIVGALATLEEKIVPLHEEVTCYGSYKFGGRRFRCWKRGGHGDVHLQEALQHSCDVYFYRMADELGIDRIARYGYMLGFGEKTGIPINDESAGRVPTREWHRKHSPTGYHPGFALNTILGQGDTLATPLQVALAYASIANGGTIWYPRLVDRVKNSDGETLFEFPPRKRKSLTVADGTLEAIRHGLWMASNEEGGTSYRHRPDPEELIVAGKTGTAQVHKIGKVRIANRDKEVRFRDHAWFASFAPYDDPEVVLVIFLQHGGHGGSDAAPVAMEILDTYMTSRRGSTLRRKVGADATVEDRAGDRSESDDESKDGESHPGDASARGEQ